MTLPKKPSSAGRIPSLIAAKKGTRVINGKKFDIPKVDLVRSLFKGSDEDRAALREVWAQLDAEQRRELAVAMANEMPGSRPKAGKVEVKEGEVPPPSGPLSIEGKEILDYMRGVELPQERLAALRQDADLSVKARLDKDTDADHVDAEIDGSTEQAPVEEPMDDTRPSMQRRELPEGVDPKALGLKDPNSDKATSRLSRQTPLHATRKTAP